MQSQLQKELKEITILFNRIYLELSEDKVDLDRMIASLDRALALVNSMRKNQEKQDSSIVKFDF